MRYTTISLIRDVKYIYVGEYKTKSMYSKERERSFVW